MSDPTGRALRAFHRLTDPECPTMISPEELRARQERARAMALVIKDGLATIEAILADYPELGNVAYLIDLAVIEAERVANDLARRPS